MADSTRLEPLYSVFSHVSELCERIDDFIVGLAERLDRLQDADRTGNLKEGERESRELVTEANTMGYAPLADAASQALECCENEDEDGFHDRVIHITKVVQRVRMGHRGAS